MQVFKPEANVGDLQELQESTAKKMIAPTSAPTGKNVEVNTLIVSTSSHSPEMSFVPDNTILK